MKSKIYKILGVVLTVIMLASLSAGLAVPAAADPGTLEWSKMSFPKPGVDGSWFRDVSITGVGPIAQGIDGSLFAYVASTDATKAGLYKSAPPDAGRTWKQTKYTDAGGGAIVAIVPSSTNADIVYVATTTAVWKSTDVFTKTAWAKLAEDSLTGTISGNITCMDVGYKAGNPFVFVGTATGGYAGQVLYLNEAGYGASAGWFSLEVDIATTDAGGLVTGEVTALDVYAIAADPAFDTTSKCIAVVTGNVTILGAAANRTFVTNNAGTVGTWTGDVQLKYGTLSDTAFTITGASRICFPSDFNSATAYELLVGVNGGGGGDVYRVLPNIAYDLGVDEDIVSLDLVGAIGSTYLLAGQYNDNEVYRSTDDGESWLATKKAPTGTGPTYVLVSDDFDLSGQAWAGTPTDGTNIGGAFSYTTDGGVLWNGISLIDTATTYVVKDITFGGTDRFMVTDPDTAPDNNDVWKYDGTYWERVECIAAVDLVQTSPAYTTDSTVFIAYSTTPVIYRSTDAGGRFIALATLPDANITGWLVMDKNTIIASAAGTTKKTKDNGRTLWTAVATTGAVNLKSFAMSPAYTTDKTIIGGKLTTGDTYISTDTGATWKLVGTTLLSATAYVAFDPLYATNSTLYAAGGAIVARYNGTKWENIGITTATSVFSLAAASGLVCSADGTLYVTDSTTTTTPGVAADAFTVTGAAAPRTGTITVASGQVTVATTGTATIAGMVPGATATITAGLGAVAWTLPAATDTFTVKATQSLTTGNIVQTQILPLVTITAVIDTDIDVLYNGATWVPVPKALTGNGIADTFSLPDAVVTAVGGAGFTGVARTLAPTAPTEAKCEWENVTKGTPPNLSSLSLTSGSNVLWGISGAYVYTYEDTLAVPVVLTSPADKASSGRETSASVTWTALTGADEYQIKCNTRSDFNGVATTVANSSVTAVNITGLNPGSTYYWKVRVAAGNPIKSRWSTVWSFTTAFGAAQWNPFSGAVSETPYPGATDMPLRPAFAWNAADWATAYELELSKSPGTTAGGFFVDAVIGMTGTNALVNTVWQCNIDLDYSTTYYWHVRAMSATSKSEWATGVFTTMAKPVPPPTPPTPTPPVELPAPISPAWIWAVVIIGAILVIAVIVLIVTTRRVP